MAIEKTNLIDILNGEGEAEAKAEKLLGLLKEDTEAQLNAVLMNKEEILAEKRESEAKRKALEEQMKALTEKNITLEDQLSKSSPDEVKKIYETRMTEATNIYEQKLAVEKQLSDERANRIKELERTQLKFECMQEFNKAITGKNIASDALNDFADYVLGVDCGKFEHRPVGEGKTVLATKDGVDIKGAVTAALETNFGKRCVVVNSSGGGAEGGVRTGSSTTNPFKTGNLTEQGKLLRENPEEFRRLKAQAGL